MKAYFKEKQNYIDDIARKYRGEFTYHDYLNNNIARMFLLNFTEFLGFSKGFVLHDLSFAFRGIFRGFMTSVLKNSLAMHFPLIYASSNASDTFTYTGFMTRFAFLNLLLLPIQMQAMNTYASLIG